MRERCANRALQASQDGWIGRLRLIGIKATRMISAEEELGDGARMLREGNGAAFVLLRVKPTDPPAFKRNMDPSACRNRFRAALLG